MSQLMEYIKIAWLSIRNNKGRSFLTMIGIIIGISSVILIVAIGKPQFITREFVKPGATVIDVGIHRNENNKLCT